MVLLMLTLERASPTPCHVRICGCGLGFARVLPMCPELEGSVTFHLKQSVPTHRTLGQAFSLCPPLSRGWLLLEHWLISLEPVVWELLLANYNRAWRVYFGSKMETGPTL